MENDLTSQIQKRMEELPEDVRSAILSSDFERKIQTIGAKYQLHIDQIGKLGDETMLVMLGFTPVDAYVGNVTEHVGVASDQARAIATDINSEILNSIRESMKRFVASVNAATPTLPPAAPAAILPIPSTSKLPSVPPPPPAPPVVRAEPPVASTSKPQVPLAPHPHDLTLVEKTITTPATPQKSTDYPADPYREPVEP